MKPNKIMSMFPRRRNNRNMLWISLVGLTLAGGATAFGMKKGKTNGKLPQFFKKLTNKMGNFNQKNLMQTN